MEMEIDEGGFVWHRKDTDRVQQALKGTYVLGRLFNEIGDRVSAVGEVNIHDPLITKIQLPPSGEIK